MKATEANLLQFMSMARQFAIPIFQRTYSWMERECLQLWNDIIRTGSDHGVSAHFVGSIVYIQDSSVASNPSPLMVIDGQQRLTTVSLILEALARKLGEAEPVDGFTAQKLRHYYLLNTVEGGDRRFKLLLTQTDKTSLFALMQQKPLPKGYSLRMHENFEFFTDRIKLIGSNLVPLCRGLAKLTIVDVSLSRDQDNPQLIFESMNSTGRELSQADLIRNYVLMSLEKDHQQNLYEDHWRPMEVEFGQEAYGSYFDSFVRHYLTFKTGEIPNIARVYESFKAYARSDKVAAQGVDALVADLHTFAGYYCNFALGKEPDKDLADAFHDLRELKVDVSYPFVLELYADYRNEILSAQDLLEAIRLIESYVFRRAISNIPTNSLNKTFAGLGRELRKDRYLESLMAYFLQQRTYRRFPDDEEFRREIIVRDLYNFPRRSYWLRRMENHERKERVAVTEYTIEHIMPQNEDLPAEWRADLGPEWQRIHETWLHTLGNLTLTGYNSPLSDRPFREKRDMQRGFKASPLKLNEGLGSVTVWNEDAIQKRAQRLAQRAVQVWTAPSLSADVLARYSKKTKRPSSYTVGDHPHLSPDSRMRPVFEEFERQVLALDDAVTEEFLKYYVAFKAETNFVDVVAQKVRLCLVLNLAFHEISDPRGLCRDVSGKGRWGNGDVEVYLKSVDEIPYVIGLVRQAFEKQMGNGDDA